MSMPHNKRRGVNPGRRVPFSLFNALGPAPLRPGVGRLQRIENPGWATRVYSCGPVLHRQSSSLSSAYAPPSAVCAGASKHSWWFAILLVLICLLSPCIVTFIGRRRRNRVAVVVSLRRHSDDNSGFGRFGSGRGATCSQNLIRSQPSKNQMQRTRRWRSGCMSGVSGPAPLTPSLRRDGSRARFPWRRSRQRFGRTPRPSASCRPC